MSVHTQGMKSNRDTVVPLVLEMTTLTVLGHQGALVMAEKYDLTFKP